MVDGLLALLVAFFVSARVRANSLHTRILRFCTAAACEIRSENCCAVVWVVGEEEDVCWCLFEASPFEKDSPAICPFALMVLKRSEGQTTTRVQEDDDDDDDEAHCLQYIGLRCALHSSTALSFIPVILR